MQERASRGPVLFALNTAGYPAGVWPASRVSAAAKRVLDILAASMLLLLAAPICLVAAILIAATSPGPVIFRQRRIGQDGRLFTCLKFRTMVRDAERVLIADDTLCAKFRSQWKLIGDPRVTPVGRWLRKLSVDELPQLLNVIMGDMSLVGPRPVQEQEYYEQYGIHGPAVFSVKPGITGLWQISGRSVVSYDRRIQLDLEYLERMGFWFDLGILFRTVPNVLLGRDAH
jgi:lipopolysaccharide/colanic/teichoic acid biosynthesis glycosyltransferase